MSVSHKSYSDNTNKCHCQLKTIVQLDYIDMVTSWYVAEGVPGSLRLVGGPNAGEGRLEVYHTSVWGTVCDDSFENVDAGLACQSLGLGLVMSTCITNEWTYT